MIFEEHFAQVQRQFLWHKQALLTPSGLSICANGTSWTAFHEAFKGENGTELVIGEHSEVEIVFSQEVESLCLEYYVVSDPHYDDMHVLQDADGHEADLFVPVPRSFYWLTLSGSGHTAFLPGPIATQPYHQILDGPFRCLTISTSQAGTVHIRKLEWTGTCRH